MRLLMCLFTLLLQYGTAEIERTGVNLKNIIGIRSYYDKGDSTAIVTWEYYPDNADIVWVRCYYAKYAYKVREEHVFTLRRDPEEALYFSSMKHRGRYRLDDGTFKLLIDRPNSRDEGIYDCEFKPKGNRTPVGNKTELARSTRLVEVRGSESSFLHGDRFGKVYFTLMPSNASINWARCFKMKSWYTGEEEHVYTYRYVSGEGMSLGRLNHRSSHEVNIKRGMFILIINMPTPEDLGEYKCEFASVIAMADPRYAVSTLRQHVPLREIRGTSKSFESGAITVNLEWTCMPSDATIYNVQCFYCPDETSEENGLTEKVYAYDFRSHEEIVYAKWRKNVYTSKEDNGIFRITLIRPKSYHTGVYRCRFQGAANTHHGASIHLNIIPTRMNTEMPSKGPTRSLTNVDSIQENTFLDGDKKVSLRWKYLPRDALIDKINCLYKKQLYKNDRDMKVCEYNYYNNKFESFENWKELRYEMGSGRFEITIKNPQPNHEGWYECYFYPTRGVSYSSLLRLKRAKRKKTEMASKGYSSYIVSPFALILCIMAPIAL